MSQEEDNCTCSVCGGDSNDKMHKQMDKPMSYFESEEYISQAKKPLVKCARCGGDTKDLDDIEDGYPNPITLIINNQNFCDMCRMAMEWNKEIDWVKRIWKGKAL